MQQSNFGRGVLENIRSAVPDLPIALSRVGSYILDHPTRVVGTSIAELATETGSGEASIFRFCQHFGYTGFRSFKLALAADIAYTNGANLAAEGGDQAPGRALADRIAIALAKTTEINGAAEIDTLAERLIAAHHVDVFGSGVTGHIAGIYAHRLGRAGLVARAFQDPVAAVEITEGSTPPFVAVAISETGLTVHTEQFLSAARRAGAFTAAISGRRLNLLNDIADLVLVAAALVPPPVRGETTPAIAKLFLCELVAGEVEAKLRARQGGTNNRRSKRG